MPDAVSIDLLGWTSALILLATMSLQVRKQWQAPSVAGLSRWLFVGQVAASIGFTLYSIALENWVFAVTNALMLVNAVVGEWLYVRKRPAACTSLP